MHQDVCVHESGHIRSSIRTYVFMHQDICVKQSVLTLFNSRKELNVSGVTVDVVASSVG